MLVSYRCHTGVIPMPNRQQHDLGTPLSICPGMELGCEPTLASPNRFILTIARSRAMLAQIQLRDACLGQPQQAIEDTSVAIIGTTRLPGTARNAGEIIRSQLVPSVHR
jgi:hypothetical protein